MSKDDKFIWSDLFDSSSEEENKYAEESSESEKSEPENIAEFDEDESGFLSCECYCFDSTLKCLNYLQDLLTKEIRGTTFRCMLTNICRCFNYLTVNEVDLNNKYRLFACDIFYRLRHELLFKALLMCLNLPQEKTDVPFRDFGIDSNRTPDLILQEDGTILVIEVSASSSLDRAAMNKGLEEAGFESKYKLELDLIQEAGLNCIYVPYLFDMSSPGNMEYLKGFEKLPDWVRRNLEFYPLLKSLKEYLCVITIQLKSYLVGPSTILFSSKYDKIDKDHDELSFMYKVEKNPGNSSKPKYKEFCVSPPVYNKILNNWHRLEDIVSRAEMKGKIQLVLDASSHKINVNEQVGGYNPEEYLEAIRDNDKFKLFKMLKLKVGRGLVPSVDSSDGVRFIEKTLENHEFNYQAIGNIVEHECLDYFKDNWIDFSQQEGMLNRYFNYNYSLIDSNPNFEESFMEMIVENDRKQNYSGTDPTTSNNNYSIVGTDLMAGDTIDNLDITEKFNALISEQANRNFFDDSIPVKIQKNKNPFLLPLASITAESYTTLDFKNKVFIEHLKEEIEISDPYTSVVLNEVLSDDFVFIEDFKAPSEQYNKMKFDKQQISREITKLGRDFYKTQEGKGNTSIRQCTIEPFCSEFKRLNNRIREISKRLEERSKIEKIKNETQLIRLPTKNKKSALGSKFQSEMEHYKDKRFQSTITGIGCRNSLDSDYSSDKAVFDNITDWMTSYAGENPNMIMDNTVSDDVKLLKELKVMALDEYKTLINDIKNSFLGHASSFVSNLAHSLLYYSQMPFNSDYVRVDNLGIKDVLLIVRGGKKIFRSKSSKMYRLVYPVCDHVIPWIESGKGLKSSTKVMYYNDRCYLITPWQGMHESILNDSISFYTRVVSFTALNLNPQVPLNVQFPRLSLNVMLSFHNRRHTEVMLANLRYILLATLGDLTGISSIFNEFLGFNYDCFQSYIRGSILLNYPKYFENLKKVKNIKDKIPNFDSYLRECPTNLFTGYRIQSEEDLALMIYSTFLMTKAPYQRPAERARNIRGILDIHEYFDETIGVKSELEEFYSKTAVKLSEYQDLESYSKAIFSNDFKFDPEYCSQIGVFADSYFESKNLKDDIFVNWNSVLNQSWDELATSTGLRGKFDDLSNFWGQKGYFVVYKELVTDKTYMESMQVLMKCSLDVDKKRKMLRELNVVYKAKIEEVKEYLLFHAVDKVQWRGGREIYVMDIETKTVQQPIEKFMGYLCSKIDNELISIPSDRRAQVIHHSIFEKDLPMRETLTWYLTLDCSKWAPKSNYLKFISTILSMEVLPPTFKTHFMNYCQKLFKKRIYFNEAEVEVIKNSVTYKSIADKYLFKDEVRKGYYLNMPYSWVMGIFNYTSSFLHALNQKYSEYIIFKTGLVSYSEETVLKMFAHSDDSGGRVTCSNGFMLKRCISLYELQLKMCNHILSKKKSVVSRFYFEILSVIYIFKKLLALLPKFLGGLRFMPSDKGPAQDMLASYSKSIEVMVAGASFNLSYMVMKFYSAMIYRFYNHNRKITIDDYRTPVQYMGLPDAHPLMVLLCGSDSDTVRLISTGQELELARQHSVVSKIINTIDDEGPIKPVKFNITVRGLKKGFEEVLDFYKDEIKSWSISNVNFHSTPFNLLSFLRKLNDPGFVGSLVNESTTRRLSRSFFMRKGACISSTIGFITLENFYDFKSILFKGDNEFLRSIDETMCNEITEEVNSYIDVSIKQIEVLKETLVSPLRICRYMNDMSLEGKQIVQTSKTLKPTHIELMKSARTFTCNFDPAQMVSYIKEPELSWALPNLRNLYTARVEVDNMCNDLGFNMDEILPSTLLKLCRNYSNKHSKEIYLYCRVPGEIRNIKTYAAFLTFLATNTFHNREIKGMVLNLQKNLTNPGYLNINIDEDIYVINNVLSVIHIFIRASSVEFMKSLSLRPLRLIDWEGGNIKELIKHIDKMSKQLNPEHYNFQLSFIKNELLEKHYSECSADFLKESSYYYFPKSQKSREGWYGSGVLVVCVRNRFYKMNLYNNLVVSMETNCIGKIDKGDVSYITDVLNKSGLSFSNKKIDIGLGRNFDSVFGVDNNGDYSLAKKFEITIGIPAFHNPVLQTPTTKCELYRVVYLSPNSFLLNSDTGLVEGRVKVYTLPLMQGEVLNIIRMVFDPKEFEKKLLEEGLGDFEDYILTEIMTSFGGETFVNPYDFFDNFQSSRLFQVFKEIKEKSISRLPNKPEPSVLPASEGSLLRVLIDHSRELGSKIIKTPGNLTPEIMELRSQYPEKVSVILSENLVKFHEKIYTPEERIEIKDSYQKLYKYQNFEELQRNAVKLMAHWGYGSLVNSIENYSLSKNSENYWYFALDSNNKLDSALGTKLFNTMHHAILESMIEMSTFINSVELPLPNLKIRSGDIKKFLSEYNTSITNNCYHNITPFTLTNFNSMIFCNYFYALLKDDDFVTNLTEKFSSDYILCSLDVSFKSRKLLIPLYNTLYYNFVNSMDEGKELNFLSKVERLGDGVRNPKDIYDSLVPEKYKGPPFKYNPQYHNFLNNDIISFFKSSYKVFSGGVEYRVSQSLVKKSNDIVRVCPTLPLDKVYNPEIFEDENWEEIDATIEMGDADVEEINELLDLIPNKFKKSKTKRMNLKSPTVQCEVTWVVDPFIQNSINSINHYRQTGENIAVISTEYIKEFLDNFPNSHCRRVNLTKKLKRESPDFLLHISCNKALTKDFWDQLVGGTIIDLSDFLLEKVLADKFIVKKGVIGGIYSLGKSFDELFNENWGKDIKDEEEAVKKPEVVLENEEDDGGKSDQCGDSSMGNSSGVKFSLSYDQYSKIVEEKIEEAYKNNVISRALRWRLTDKYLKKSKNSDFHSLEELFLNCLNEVALGTLNSNIKDGKLELSKDDYIKVFLAPTHFGMAQTHSRGDPRNMKDRKIAAEVNSLNSSLSSMIASGTLTISKRFHKIACSNYKMWMNVTKGTKYKRENKKFLLILFLSILNCGKISDSESDDHVWQNVVNLITPYIADDGPDSDDDDEEFLDFDTNIIHGSRLLYKVSGVM